MAASHAWHPVRGLRPALSLHFPAPHRISVFVRSGRRWHCHLGVAHRACYPLYAKPTPDFVPYLYAPLYFYLAAALSKLIGVGYAFAALDLYPGNPGKPLRYLRPYPRRDQVPVRKPCRRRTLCSLLPSAGRLVRRWPSGLPVRVPVVTSDLLHPPCPNSAGRSRVARSLSGKTDGPAGRRTRPLCRLAAPATLAVGLATLLAGFAASILVMNHLTGGWYSYYLFGTAKGLPWVMRTAVFYIPVDLLQPLGLAFLLISHPSCACRRYFAAEAQGSTSSSVSRSMPQSGTCAPIAVPQSTP